MTPSLADLRRIAEAATPGPWMSVSHGRGYTSWLETTVRPLPDGRLVLADHIKHDEDAEYIATFNPVTVIALLDRLQAAEECVKMLNCVNARAGKTWRKCDPKHGLCGPCRVLAAFDALAGEGK